MIDVNYGEELRVSIRFDYDHVMPNLESGNGSVNSVT